MRASVGWANDESGLESILSSRLSHFVPVNGEMFDGQKFVRTRGRRLQCHTSKETQNHNRRLLCRLNLACRPPRAVGLSILSGSR